MTDRREQDGQGRFGRQADRGAEMARRGGWIGGAILIFIGTVFLLKNFGFPFPENWWAAFILIPAYAAFEGAHRIYAGNGGVISAGVIGGIAAGCLLALLSVLFLFGVDVGRYWPLILIVIGIAILTGAMAPGRDPRG